MCACVGKASPLGSTFQAIVSVMAVKIQFSSPRGVRLSLSLPGILHHTQHNTDGTVSAALTACHTAESEHKRQLLSSINTTYLKTFALPGT